MSEKKYIQPTLDELFSKDKLQIINESKFVDALQINWGPDREKLITNRDTSIKDQIGPKCTAYGTIAAMENKLGGSIDLSEFDLWYKYRKSNIDRAIAAAENNFICEEKYWPEGYAEPSEGYIGRCKLVHSYLGRDFSKVLEAIDKDNPCVVAFATPNQLGKDVLQIDPKSGVSNGVGHVVCVSGYKVEGGKGYFLVKNSWGPRKYPYQFVPFELYDRIRHIYFYEVVTVEDKNL